MGDPDAFAGVDDKTTARKTGCPDCGAVLAGGPSNLAAHRLRRHASAADRAAARTANSCYICDTGFLSTGDLERHADGVHHTGSYLDGPPRIRPSRCKECGRDFKYRHQYHTHVSRSHSSSSSPPFLCDRCGMGFANRGNLNRHLANVHGMAK